MRPTCRNTRIITSISTALVLVCFATPSCADWQYAKWGMSPEEVQSASKGAAVPNADRRLDAETEKTLLVAPFHTGDFAFQSQFRFNANRRLIAAVLELRDKAQCPQLVYQLNNTYQTPAYRSKSAVTYVLKWYDEPRGNEVAYLEIAAHSCSVRYSSLGAPGAPDGL